ncbi:50S ribosomal protein L30 [Candidatus Woesearchaeota archaeon]|nr:50S ribosomal protein L30 [Candidatus Woesearchaeota archaeon]
MNKNIVIIRLRGRTGVRKSVNDTLDMMRLYKQNGCVIVPNTPQYLGMIKKAKDYITWGEIDQETFTLMFTKRARIVGDKPLTDEYLKQQIKVDTKTFVEEVFNFKKKLKDVPGLKPYFRLTPPSKGFERGGIKKPFSMGGSLGYRKDKINDLIKRML